MGRFKGDLINKAYSKGRISGLTSQPTPEELQLGLDTLEEMSEEFKERNICVNYNFEDTPDLNSLHNIHRKYWFAFTVNLAGRLLTDFGKTPDQLLASQIFAGFSFLSASTAPMRQTQYPVRHPVGSGNSLKHNRFNRYYRPAALAPLSCETNVMIIGAIDNFVEHFDSYLNDGETIASYVLTNDDGLTITNDTLASPDITYTVEAVGGSGDDGPDSLLQIKIVATTSTGRVEPRIINFELNDVTVG